MKLVLALSINIDCLENPLSPIESQNAIMSSPDLNISIDISMLINDKVYLMNKEDFY